MTQILRNIKFSRGRDEYMNHYWVLLCSSWMCTQVLASPIFIMCMCVCAYVCVYVYNCACVQWRVSLNLFSFFFLFYIYYVRQQMNHLYYAEI